MHIRSSMFFVCMFFMPISGEVQWAQAVHIPADLYLAIYTLYFVCLNHEVQPFFAIFLKYLLEQYITLEKGLSQKDEASNLF